MPHTLSVCNDDSLGVQILRTFPQLKGIKSLNSEDCKLIDPTLITGEYDIFICGNDIEAKDKVKSNLDEWFGWRSIIDLGNITAARGMRDVIAYLHKTNGDL